jgi:hypothetical protein
VGVPAKTRSSWTIQTGLESHLEPAAPLRFLNHSCDPNTGMKTDARGNPGLYARVPIAPGDEVTWDYAMSEADFIIDGEAGSFPCLCGSPRCRKIVSGGWSGLDAQRRRDYAEWRLPHLPL